LAILHALKQWWPYLMGRHFKVKMDHDILKYFLEQILSLEEQKKWVTNMLGYDFEIIYKKREEKCCCKCTLKRRWGCGSIVLCYFYYPTRLDKQRKGWMEEGWRSVATHSKVVEDPRLNNIARTWWRRKNHIGTWSSHRNKNPTTTKSIIFKVSHQVEELTCWRFHMPGQTFYTEASRTSQGSRTTLFEGEVHVGSLY